MQKKTHFKQGTMNVNILGRSNHIVVVADDDDDDDDDDKTKNNIIYLNSATAGLPSKQTLESIQKHLQTWQSSGGTNYAEWDDDAEQARQLLASNVLHCNSDRVVLLNSASGAVALTLHTFVSKLLDDNNQQHSTFIVGGSDFSSTILPLESFAKQSLAPVEIITVPFKNNRLEIKDLVDAMDETTVFVCVSHVQSASGFLLDVETLENECVARNVALFVDATQSAGAIDLPKLENSFIGAAAYKWLCSPKVISVVRWCRI
jgi:selenocysteine lyase/cysteine desulfurase